MTEPGSTDDLTRLLTEIRDDQGALLALFSARQEEVRALQARAEALQDRSARMIGTVQRVMPIVLVVVVILIAYVSWLVFRIMR